jgi:holo-[acyl-carrier protein] synthase
MKVIGIGLDLTEIGRIRDLLAKHGERFKERTFTLEECAYCDSHTDPAPHYAARFAAKEAVAKALGTGFSQGVGWLDIEVLRAESGQPSVCLHGGAAAYAEQLGINQWMITLSHSRDTAAASVVAGCS